MWNDRRTCQKLCLRPDNFQTFLWIVWHEYMKMCEWLIGVEYDVYYNVLYFSPLLELWEFYEVVELLWWCCWWLYMFMCIYVVGEFSIHAMVLNCWCKHVMNDVSVDCWSCVNICIVVNWVICSCIITCCWQILCIQLFTLIIRVAYDVFVVSWGDDLGVDWYHMHVGVVSRRIAWSWK